ncbi:MAG: prepilin-type N-terminal cleavage/methylation domain-containing protein, partial [Gammaproteobacteria bacterium]|nr:prepilin-type N-terminal cleavage/methylation domain-containing protein [Gammaproteobacteria bacterium]
GVSTNRKGFTLVELLIVVIILAILAAIIVPQFSAATDDANQSAFDTNVANIRSAVDLYRQQHGAYPGTVISGGGTCDTGAPVAGAIGSASFIAQLKNYTNAAGEACTGTGVNFKYGPYLKDDLPVNPLGTSNTLTVVSTGILGLSTGSTGGWRFDSLTGEFIGDQAP